MRALLLLIYHDYGDAKEAVVKEGKEGKGVVVVHHQGTHPIHPIPHPPIIHISHSPTNLTIRRRGSSSSSTGGATRQGSGVQPSFPGARYAGGSKTPYASGARSPLGLTPVFLGAGVGGALALYPGLWLHGAYLYPYSHPYTFVNRSAANATAPQGANETKPVVCMCAAREECGCEDESGDTQVLDSLVGNGSYEALNKTLVNVAVVNGSSTILLNGTLANGTTVSGGQEDANKAGALVQKAGYAVLIACLVGFLV
jgi:hypothetical protein